MTLSDLTQTQHICRDFKTNNHTLCPKYCPYVLSADVLISLYQHFALSRYLFVDTAKWGHSRFFFKDSILDEKHDHRSCNLCKYVVSGIVHKKKMSEKLRAPKCPHSVQKVLKSLKSHASRQILILDLKYYKINKNQFCSCIS